MNVGIERTAAAVSDAWDASVWTALFVTAPNAIKMRKIEDVLRERTSDSTRGLASREKFN